MTKQEQDAAFEAVWARGREAGQQYIPYWQKLAAEIRQKGVEPLPPKPSPAPTVETVLTLIEGRLVLNQNTSERHPDPGVRRDASLRAAAYNLMVDEVWRLLGRPVRQR